MKSPLKTTTKMDNSPKALNMSHFMMTQLGPQQIFRHKGLWIKLLIYSGILLKLSVIKQRD